MSNYVFNSNEQTFEEFVSESILKESKNKLVFKPEDLKGLLNPIFDNILYQNRHEIYIEYHTSSYVFKITKIPSKLNMINFGCELETCFIMNCNNKNLDVSYKKLFKLTWTEKVAYYLQNNVIPYLKNEFTEKFRYGAIYNGYHNNNGILLDMKTNKILDISANLDESYKTLIFEPDGSIECDEKEGVITLPCEIVTPILSSIDDLKILYEGLSISENCNQSNKSMGFHVNVSGIDIKNQIIPLTYGFLNELIQEWLPYEKKHYKTLRPESGSYAQSLSDRIENLYKNNTHVNLENKNLYIDDYTQKNGPYIRELISIINHTKNNSITNYKQINVIEFRVFGSNNNISKLIDYTQDAMNVFQSAMNRYLKDVVDITSSIQKVNTQIKYSLIDKSLLDLSKINEFIYIFYFFRGASQKINSKYINLYSNIVYIENKKLFGSKYIKKILTEEEFYNDYTNFLNKKIKIGVIVKFYENNDFDNPIYEFYECICKYNDYYYKVQSYTKLTEQEFEEKYL